MTFSELRSIRSVVIPVSFALLALIPPLAGCGKRATTAPPELVPLTLRGGGTGLGSVSALKPGSLASADSDTTHVVVSFTTALLVVRDVRFKTSDESEGEQDSTGSQETQAVFAFASADTNTVETEDDGDEGMIIFRGPFVIDLLTRHAADLDVQLVPPGMYRRVQGHLQGLRPGDPASTARRSIPTGSTVFLEGTISGEGGGPFTYEARIDDEFQIRGDFTIQEDTPATAFITFDLSRWLVDREGRFLDPRDPENAQAIESAVRHSIKVQMGDTPGD